jgi:hypothetical protein
MSVIKRGLGALTVAVALSAATGVLAATPANAAPAQAQAWTYVRSYFPANDATWRQCNADGQYYADGSTGYECRYFPSSWQTHTPHYELYVGP